MTTRSRPPDHGPNSAPREVVTSFLQHADKILVLRRSEQVRTYRGRWAGVSGSIDGGRTAEQQARLEILEETTLTDDDVRLVAAGLPLAVDDAAEGRQWIVHPFRFSVLHPEKIKTDWEHVETRWIVPVQIQDLETVPNLAEAWARVAG